MGIGQLLQTAQELLNWDFSIKKVKEKITYRKGEYFTQYVISTPTHQVDTWEKNVIHYVKSRLGKYSAEVTKLHKLRFKKPYFGFLLALQLNNKPKTKNQLWKQLNF